MCQLVAGDGDEGGDGEADLGHGVAVADGKKGNLQCARVKNWL